MAGGKQTPRQRMIGILYLVLLGLIALDVPDSLLDAFKHISDSLSVSEKNVQAGIANEFADFEQTTLKSPTPQITKIYERAKKARGLADALDKYVDSLKKIMVAQTGGISESTGDYEGRENLDVSVYMMVDPDGKKNAYDLHKKIDATREGLIKLLDPKDTVGVELPLQAAAPPHINGFPDKNWEEANFGEGIPMGAAMTAFTKIQADTKNAENLVVTKILEEASKSPVHLDQFAAVAVAPTSYVLVGQTYTAQVFLTAYDSKVTPDITVEGARIPVQDGKGIYNGSTSTEGEHHWSGVINVRQTDGTVKPYPIPQQTYMVAKPSAVVSPDKMLVLYAGVANPVSVSAPSVPKEKLKVTITGGDGSLSGSDGHYIAIVHSIGTATISVSGELTPGKLSFLGSTVFKVKPIPDPTPQFAGLPGGSASAEQIKSEEYVFAKLEHFDFDAGFKVVHFGLVVLNANGAPKLSEVNGNRLSEEMKRDLQSIRPGSTIVIKDIEAVGPDGRRRNLDESIVLTVTN